MAVIFQIFIYHRTNMGLLIALYLLTGLSLASWSQLVAVPFGTAPTFAAIASTFLAVILAVIALIIPSSVAVQIVLTIIFPPMAYVFLTKNLTAFEAIDLTPNILHTSPKTDAPLLVILLMMIVSQSVQRVTDHQVDIFLFPAVAAWLESGVYGVRPPGYVSWFQRCLRRNKYATGAGLPPDVAVQVDHMRKEYNTKKFGIFGRAKPFVAIDDLSFSVPRGQIFCLLGRNGAAKSTTLLALAQLLPVSGGDIRYAEDLQMGIASQKDVLWDELTCRQHIDLWRVIKSTTQDSQCETNNDLLDRCDLGPKKTFLSKNLSGGQKRKLQLACALAGGSNLLLLDEITSGLDPLSRRAIWRLITSNRGRATILLTTHCKSRLPTWR